MEVAGVALVRSDFGGDRVDGWDGMDGRAGLVCLSKIDSVSKYIDRRKFGSQTSDNVDR